MKNIRKILKKPKTNKEDRPITHQVMGLSWWKFTPFWGIMTYLNYKGEPMAKDDLIDQAMFYETDDHYHVGVSLNKEAVHNVAASIAVMAGTAVIGFIAQKALTKRE